MALQDLFTQEDKDTFCNAVRTEVKATGMLDSPENCWDFFINKVCATATKCAAMCVQRSTCLALDEHMFRRCSMSTCWRKPKLVHLHIANWQVNVVWLGQSQKPYQHCSCCHEVHALML
jgi:hypothetical protein